MRIAVVTGASSGMGKEFVLQLAKDTSVDEIWAVARRREKLEELKEAADCSIVPIPLDLINKESIDVLSSLYAEKKPDIAYLVNAAGFGRIGESKDISIKDNDDMIDLNCRAAVDITVISIPYMGRGSRIIEICSASGYQPLTGINTYAASKAFLMSWTKSLHHELVDSGIHVTAVSPYWVKGTEFIPTARLDDRSTIRHFPLASRAKSVVKCALLGSKLNMWVVSASFTGLGERFFAKIIPHCVIVPFWDLLRRL